MPMLSKALARAPKRAPFPLRKANSHAGLSFIDINEAPRPRKRNSTDLLLLAEEHGSVRKRSQENTVPFCRQMETRPRQDASPPRPMTDDGAQSYVLSVDPVLRGAVVAKLAEQGAEPWGARSWIDRALLLQMHDDRASVRARRDAREEEQAQKVVARRQAQKVATLIRQHEVGRGQEPGNVARLAVVRHSKTLDRLAEWMLTSNSSRDLALMARRSA